MRQIMPPTLRAPRVNQLKLAANLGNQEMASAFEGEKHRSAAWDQGSKT
jgi:hypothetical protein